MARKADGIDGARQAAIQVLLHNMHGPYRGLPRTAGWGYPEPYTRDLMIAGLGILVSGNRKLPEATFPRSCTIPRIAAPATRRRCS
jgi:hypothetical protein